MSYRTDSGGLAFKCGDIKLSGGVVSTWGTKLSQLKRQTGAVHIVTYSLPSMDYVREQLGRRPENIFIVCHSKFITRALDIRRHYPKIRVSTNSQVHSKVLLIEPATVYITSANFGQSGWHESAIGLHSQAAHSWYLENVFTPLWQRSLEVVLAKG